MGKRFPNRKLSTKKKKSGGVKGRFEKSMNRNFVGNDRIKNIEMIEYLKNKHSEGVTITINNCNISIKPQFDSNKQDRALIQKTVPNLQESKKAIGRLAIVSDLISVYSFLRDSLQPYFQGIKHLLALF